MANYDISPDRPLPKKLEDEYWETVAKLILETIFPERFTRLSVDKESPDLRNENTGIEVTSCINQKTQELDNLYIRYYIYGEESRKEIIKDKIERLGGKINEFALSHPGVSRDLSLLYSCVKNKLSKLNKNYEVFDSNFLFIFTIDYIADEELSSLLESIIELSLEFAIRFNSVFLCSLGGDLYEFDILNETFSHFVDSRISIQEQAIKARKLIEKKYQKLN